MSHNKAVYSVQHCTCFVQAGVLSGGAAAPALFILRENIHLGVYSLAATRPFGRFKYLLWSEGNFVISFHGKWAEIIDRLVFECCQKSFLIGETTQHSFYKYGSTIISASYPVPRLLLSTVLSPCFPNTPSWICSLIPKNVHQSEFSEKNTWISTQTDTLGKGEFVFKVLSDIQFQRS